MGSVPDRFLGYAFSAGDLLIETDADFIITSVDGAASLLGLSDGGAAVGVGLYEFVSDSDRTLLNGFDAALSGRSRIGPMRVVMGPDAARRRPVMLSVASIPGQHGRFFFVISLPYKMGLEAEEVGRAGPSDARTESFLDRLGQLLLSPEEELEGIAITLFEATGTTAADEDALQETDRLLQAFSMGGSFAVRLSGERFAAVFNEDQSGSRGSLLMYNLGQSTGLQFSTTSLDSFSIAVQGEDGRRAMTYTMRMFADGEDGFDALTLSKDYQEMIGEIAQKVGIFRDILDHHKFSFAYQPIVRIGTGEIVRHEVLARFEGTALAGQQGETIHFAEKVGMIPEFDLSVVRSAMDMLSGKDGDDRPALAVNISAKSLSSALCNQKIMAMLGEHRDLASNLMLEVTESSHIDDIAGLGTTLQEIRDLGFKVVLDDFGTSSAGFEALRELQVDGIKIDGHEVQGAVSDNKTRAFIRAMVSLCRDLGIKTTAEWVQDEGQAQMLSGLGIDYGQGFHYGKPSSEMR